MKKNLLSMRDLNSNDLDRILETSFELKSMKRNGMPHALLPGRSLAMIFEKSSTRTRISFEAGMSDLGGHALFLNPNEMQLGRGEEIRDTARVLSGYVSAIMIRSYLHSTITDFARYSRVPVINGLSNLEHPCQTLADVMTIRERFGNDDVKVAWIGDGNNVCNSLILASAITEMEVAVAAPACYEPDSGIIDTARANGGTVSIEKSIKDCVSGADVIYTDIWISMGDENEKEERMKAFRGFTVTDEILEDASPDAVVMHCLPAHRGEEITDSVIEGEKSIVWEQAENRLHAQKGLLVRMMG